LLIGLPATSSATGSEPLTVSAKASPASGTRVDPGATVSYSLDAQSHQALPQGATVVDDLSGLLGNATVTTSAAQLAKQSPDARHEDQETHLDRARAGCAGHPCL
jgi:hypothetical protein